MYLNRYGWGLEEGLCQADVEIVVHPGILVPRRILSWQKDLAQVYRTCRKIKWIPIIDRHFFLKEGFPSVKIDV